MFIHLHCHFVGSFSDSVLKIEPAVSKAKKLGQNSIAITDHGEIPFFYEFYDACQKYRIKPIFGSEIYFVDDAKKCIDKGINERFHLVLLTKNKNGLKNLFSLLSDSWLQNSFKEKRGLVDWALIEKYNKDIIALSGCFYNIVGQKYVKQGIDTAQKDVKRFQDIFGSDFYIEIGRHSIEEEEKVNKGLIELAKKNNINIVCTNDVHYLNPEDSLVHSVIMKTRYDKVSNFQVESNQYWLKSEQEMDSLKLEKEWLDESCKISEKCENIVIDKEDLSSLKQKSDFDIKDLISQGHAAYLSKIVYIDRQTALRHCKEVLGEKSPDIDLAAGQIEGIPRRSEPDTNKIVYFPDKLIKEIIPLKRSLGKIVTQWDEQSCKRAGAQILSIIPSPLAQQLTKFNGLTKNNKISK